MLSYCFVHGNIYFVCGMALVHSCPFNNSLACGVVWCDLLVRELFLFACKLLPVV